MLAHTDAFPIIILVAILHSVVFYYGENLGNLIICLAVELPKTIIKYASTRPKSYEDRFRLVKAFVEHMVAEKQLPSMALQKAITGINLGSFSELTINSNSSEKPSPGTSSRNFRNSGFKRSFTTKKNQNSGKQFNNNNKKQGQYWRHFCHGPACIVRGCHFNKQNKN